MVFELVWTSQEELKGEVYIVWNCIELITNFVKKAWTNSDVRLVFFEEAFRSQFGVWNHEASDFSSFPNHTDEVGNSIRYG